MVIMKGLKESEAVESHINLWLKSFEKTLSFKTDIKWKNVIVIALYHALCLYSAIYYAFPVKWQTVLFVFCTHISGGFGVTVGAHRFWTHRTFKATTPLKIFTLICFASAGLNSIMQWVRDHRVHHKYSDTDADPHNVTRGIFFSHIGWLMLKKHPEVIRRGHQMDMSDLRGDPFVRFFDKYHYWLMLMLCYVLPMAFCVWGLGEQWKTAGAWLLIRHVAILHSTFSVNSLAHAIGYRPYNKELKPTENSFVSTLTFGEGWHNYHHTFPFDYKAAEFGDFLNWGTASIDMFRKLGLAYDLKEATPEMIASVTARSGDDAYKRFLGT